MLFSIFISNLGPQLNNKGYGIDLGNFNIGAIFFADDLVLIGRSEKALCDLMGLTRKFFRGHHLELSEKKSKVVSHDAGTGHLTFKGAVEDPLTLEEVLSYNIEVRTPHNIWVGTTQNIERKSLAVCWWAGGVWVGPSYIIMPLFVSILEAETCQILSLAPNPR